MEANADRTAETMVVVVAVAFAPLLFPREVGEEVYDSGSMQVISVDTKTSPNRATATIRPINSSFAQSYEYVIDKNTCHITEFIPTKNNPTAIRRQYVYRQDDKTKVITADGRKFSVALEDNNITFIRVD